MSRSHLKNGLLPIFEPLQATPAREQRGLRVAPHAFADASASVRAILGAARSHLKGIFEMTSRSEFNVLVGGIVIIE